MSIITLYKNNVNQNASGVEIHKFLSLFNLNSILIEHPLDDNYNNKLMMERERNIQRCKEWIVDFKKSSNAKP
jgi:hypothetical protein